MKKILVIMLLLASAYAKPTEDWYVGIGFFGGTGEQTLETSSASATVAYDTGGADIKFGVIFKTDNRFELSWITIDAEAGGGKGTFKGKDFDWIFTSPLNNKDSLLLPFISAGFGSYTYDNTAALTGSNQDIQGVSGQVGIGIYLQLDFEIEISYKNKLIVWEDYDNSGTTSLSEEMTNFYVGAKYKF